MKRYLLFILSACAVSAGAQDIHANLENALVSAFLNEVTYEPGDESLIADYLPPAGFRADQPRPALVEVPQEYWQQELMLCYSEDEFFEVADTVQVAAGIRYVEIANLIPQHTYYYLLKQGDDEVAGGKLFTMGQVRMIGAPTLFNVRDCGGWTTENGQRMRYGLLYRGGELNGLNVASEADVELLKQLGIGAEIDMRYEGERDEQQAAGFSALGFSAEEGTYLCTQNSGAYAEHMAGTYWTQRYRQEFEFIVSNLKAGRSVYHHCIWGADRTGMLSILLEGVLGVRYDQMVKDYELSSMSAPVGLRQKGQYFDDIINYINGLKGETLRDRFNYYVTIRLRVSQDDVDYLRAVLLEDIPPYNPDYDVTVGVDQQPFASPQQSHSATYNLLGQPAAKAAGVVVKDGKKVMMGR